MEHSPEADWGGKKSFNQLRHNLGEGDVLVLGRDSATILEYVATGEYAMRTVGVGETEYTFRVPVHEAMSRKTYEVDYTEAFNSSVVANARPEGRLTTEFQAAARAMVAEHAPDDGERVPCVNCKDKRFFTSACHCTYGGVVSTDEETQTVDRLRKEGDPDPACQKCDGTGSVTNACHYCKGTGYSYRYPELSVVNDTTGERASIILNIAQLVSANILDIRRTDYADTYRLQAKVTNLMKDLATQVGVDPEKIVGVEEGRYYEVDDDRNDLIFYPTREGGTNNGTRVIESFQKSATHQFAWDWSAEYDGQGVVRTKVYRVTERANPLDDLLATIDHLAEKGYKLGYHQTFIETGTSGPGFIMLDDEGRQAADLGADYSLAVAINNAHRAALSISFE